MTRLNRDQLVQLAKSEIEEITVHELKQWLDGGEKLTLIDIRERDEFVQGHLPDATFIPRGYLELQIEQHQTDRDQPVVLYCAGGVRSALAARNLKEMGYSRVISLIGGFNGWKNAGFDFKIPTVLTEEQRMRYSRHTLLNEVGEAGQIKLLEAKVLLIGAGGLGSPAAMYLAAAGVGTLGIVDFDTVDVSNLQRQMLHGTKDVGRPKVESAADRLPRPQPRRQGDRLTTSRSPATTPWRSSATTTSCSMGRTTSRPATWSTMPASSWASRWSTPASSCSKARSRSTCRENKRWASKAGRAIAVSIRIRRRPAKCRAAPKRACWACCPASSARFRRSKPSS